MKTISRRLLAWIVAGLALSAGAQQVEGRGAVALWIAATSIAQAGGQDLTPEDRRAAASDLVEAARQSMKTGNWETADSQLQRAEVLEASFGLLHFGDTPKKARQELERLRTKAAAPQRGLDRFLPFNRTQEKQATDENPFAGRETTDESPSQRIAPPRAGAPDRTLTGDAQRSRAMPRNPAARPLETQRPLAASPSQPGRALANPAATQPRAPTEPAGQTSGLRTMGDAAAVFETPATERPVARPQLNRPQVAPNGNTVAGREVADEDPKARSNRLLLTARQALSRGDARRARAHVEQALALKIRYQLTEDTPQKIVAAIERHQAIAENRAEMGDSESFRREQADFLMEQAEALLHWNDLDEAERLAQDVSRLRVELGPFDAQPAALLERIAAARRGGMSATPRDPMLAAQRASAGPSEAEKLAKARAADLVGKARSALGIGDVRQAERMARQAEALRVPDYLFVAGEDRPSSILSDIQQRKSGDVRLAGGDAKSARDGVERAHYNPQTDKTRNVVTGGEEPGAFDFPPSTSAAQQDPATTPDNGSLAEPAIIAPGIVDAPIDEVPAAKPLKNSNPEVQAADVQQALTLIERGESVLGGGDRNTALVYFRQAAAFNDALPPDLRQRLDGHLAQLNQEASGAPAVLSDGAGTPIALPAVDDPEQQQPPAELPPGQGASPYADPPGGYAPPSAVPSIDAGEPVAPPAALPESLLGKTAAEQQVATRQLHAQISRRLADARNLRESEDPKQAVDILKELRTTVEGSALESAARQQYLLRIDRALNETQQFIEKNRFKLEFKEQGAATKAQVDREEELKVEVDNRVAMLVEEFNQLVDQRRFSEAEVVARKADEIAHDNPVVVQLLVFSRLLHSVEKSKDLRSAKEQGFVDALDSVERSSEPFDDSNPHQFPNIREWEKLTARRKSFPADQPVRNERELEIIRKLRTPVSLQFENAPLSQVLGYLAKIAEINLFLDPQGLAEEAVTTDTPVTIDLNQDISLKSALNLILEPLHLSYIIKDEVLKVTSEQFRDGNIVPQTYPVADLVIPIPNFIPGPRVGMASALQEAYNTLGYNGAPGFAGVSPMTVVASKDGTPNSAMINPAILAQSNIPGGSPTLAGALANATQPLGPGGAGGGAAADYDSLIRLITTTIAPTTWDEVGGSGAISPFRGNLSLVISNTEEVHDQIRDLLAQLRRLQDLQVTIEVRFITLSDNFFERIGIDFDFDINSSLDKPFQLFGRSDPAASTTYQNPPFVANGGVPRDVQDRNLTRSESVSVGLTAPNVFSTDLDIPFRQDSFTLAVPQFGGFDPTAGASFGFAILSDIETFFFLNAAQGDRRTNVLQAPKVTLFNGQQASVSDQSQSPFVISVIPVVGDFAAAQQPVIIILSEGTFMTVQAVVSSDRRFVRLTVVPFFSNIGDVDTFTFTGSSTTTTSSGSVGPVDDTSERDEEETTITEGTTVQLPTFSFVTVTTTVSVPDGGTVLLGGIKRLSEGRTEFGVPILNKLPYVNRLFKNVGVGRETSSLMMMVTPRIIIQEEEESLLGINPSTTPAP